MICETHGRVGFVEVCSHVGAEIEGGIAPRGHRLKGICNLLVCEECFQSLDLRRFSDLAELPVEEAILMTDGRLKALQRAYEAIEGQRVQCVRCLEDLGPSKLA